MYSVVLMMAMTSGGDVADLGHRHGGCCGGESYSCCGGVSYGCCGGGHHRHHRHHRGGCCGGEAYSGCCGGGYSGCCGGYAVYSGCCGGSAGGAVYNGVNDGLEHHEMHDGDKDGHHDGKKDGGKVEEELKTKPKPEVSAPAPATIIVSLPASARLTIDGAATTSTSSRRVFTTPVMPAGQEFHYTLEAKYVRAGRPVVLSREVTVRAGEETRVNLEAVSASVASR
jgi:uncharacterized protein (TIGR03000 family)